MYMSIKEIIEASKETGKSLSQLMIKQEMEVTGASKEEVLEGMRSHLHTMQQAAARSVEGDGVHSPTGLSGGDVIKMLKYRQKGNTLSDDRILKAVQDVLGTTQLWVSSVPPRQRKQVERFQGFCFPLRKH